MSDTRSLLETICAGIDKQTADAKAAYENAVASNARRREQIMNRVADVHAIERVIGLINGEVQALPSYWGGGINLHVSTRVKLLDAPLEFLRAISRVGFKRTTPPMMSGENMVWSYTAPGGTPVQLFVRPAADSPTCKKVQVGVKMVEEPVYEIVCDGEKVAAPTEEVA